MPTKTHSLILLVVLCLSLITTPIFPSVTTQSSPAVKSIQTSKSQIISKNLPPPPISAEAVYVLDLKTNEVLFSRNEKSPMAPASLTKIVTAIIALNHFQPDEILRVKNGSFAEGNVVHLQKDDQLKSESVIKALLISSGNDAALTLAENYKGGYSAFVSDMNSLVQKLELPNTKFQNVSGVQSSDHYTSAKDITLLAKYALGIKEFERIVSQKEALIVSEKGTPITLTSTNVLLGEDGVSGIKTGWTPEAGECLVVLIVKNNQRILVSLLNSKDRFGDARLLNKWIFENYAWQTVKE